MGDKKFPFTVRAIADYSPTSESEVVLITGQIYEVVSDDGKGVWWQTTVSGQLGWFPANYTEVINKNNTPPPTVTSSPTPQETPQPTSSNTKSSKKSNLKKSKSGGSKGKSKGGKKKNAVAPIPSKTYKEKNKKELPCSLNLQVVEAKELKAVKGDPSKSKTSAHIFVKNLLTGDERKAFSLDVQKKTLTPRWNYLFQIVIQDGENEVVIIRLCQGESCDKKSIFGETQIVLRSTERNFDAPNSVYEWYPLTMTGSPQGQIRLYLQYVDSRQTSGPTNFRHESHIGYTKDKGFDVENIPQEWKELFKEVGITKGQLRDKNFAETVYNIIQETTDMAPPPPAPLAPTMNSGGPAPPPPPPPPSSSSTISTPPMSLPKPSSNTLVVENDDDGNDLLASIRKGKTLNKLEVSETPKPPSDSGGGLEDMLRKAMASHRKVVSDDADEDWSEDDEWDDD